MHTNALSQSTSPYLKQHQQNPVNWVPWGEAAWQRAREEDKLVIVSVGYSACHWCHVMEHETFEDEEAATYMNAHFVSIKVDREERPDVDQVYMDAVQLMTRRGGWPLNCVALPDGRPIWGGTYFPKAQWLAGLNAVLEVWKEDPEKVEAYAAQLAETVGAMDDASQGGPAGETLVDIPGDDGDVLQPQVDAHLVDGLASWRATWDPEYGGGRGAPKFPLPCQIECWLRLADAGWMQEGEAYSGPLGWTPEWRDALGKHAMLTLRAMARGGIHDHVGGGFSRYSVDERWHVPHFEKMLYDNGQLLGAYAEAWRCAPHPALMQAAEGIVAFLTRELDDPSGGFRSALDADSDGAEGTYYVWRMADLKAALPDEEVRKEVIEMFDVDGRSFWEQGQNVLMRPTVQDDALWADDAKQRRMTQALKRMSDWRDSPASGRAKPGLDDKVLTAWTALAVTGLAKAGRLMHRPEWVARAERGGAFLRDVATLSGEDHVLRRSWHADGGPEVEGFSEDYALTIEAMIELHQSTLDDHWLREARAWMAVTLERF
ncbi:MAG: thioredoxin domain-containing protein, partial [Flavobacteriales bacterium]